MLDWNSLAHLDLSSSQPVAAVRGNGPLGTWKGLSPTYNTLTESVERVLASKRRKCRVPLRPRENSVDVEGTNNCCQPYSKIIFTSRSISFLMF